MFSFELLYILKFAKWLEGGVPSLLTLYLFQFPGEVYNYWIQHTLIFFVIPPYLIYIWGTWAAAWDNL